MLAKIAQIGSRIKMADFIKGCKGIFISQESRLNGALANRLALRHLWLVNSGTAAFYLILRGLKNISSRRDVILPAYTASSVVLAIRKAGLRVKLCDISLKDFNMDLSLLGGIVTADTLAIVPTYMFGLGISGIAELKRRFPDIFIIEDCAQALGTEIAGKPVGIFSDASFFSFGRGKNLSTYAGGFIATSSTILSKEIKEEILNLASQKISLKLATPFKIAAFSLLNYSFIYGLACPLVSCFKDNTVPKDFQVSRYTSFQAGMACSLLERLEESSLKRFNNGMRLIAGLKNVDSVIVPCVSEDTEPAFNRLPVLFKDSLLREKTENALFKAGIDTSRMYVKPLHHIFDLGYKKDDFPNAAYLAEHLLTLPTHQFVRQKDLDRMIKVMRAL